MKILFTFFNPSGGMETLNRIRCMALASHGVECHLLYTHDGEGRKNIRNIPVLITNQDDRIRDLLELEAFDLIVVCTDISLTERIRTLGYTGLLIFEVQGLGMIDEARKIIYDFSERIRRYADALLYPETVHLQTLFQESFPMIPQYCFDNPVECVNFGYTPYPIKDYPIIGWVGRIQANKNWREFLEIGRGLLQIHPNLYLWMFQDDTLYDIQEKADFDQYTAEIGISSRLIKYSNVPHELMADYLSIIGDSGGFLCSTSILEGFGYAVAEAMLCRCPVLTTDSDGIRRLVTHNKTGLIYNRGQMSDALEAALSLLHDNQLREQIRRKAEEHIRTNLSSELYVKNFMKMYQNLMSQKRS